MQKHRSGFAAILDGSELWAITLLELGADCPPDAKMGICMQDTLEGGVGVYEVRIKPAYPTWLQIPDWIDAHSTA